MHCCIVIVNYVTNHKSALGMPSLSLAMLAGLGSCKSPEPQPAATAVSPQKVVVYQMFTRLFGNKNTTNCGNCGKESSGKK